MSEMSKMSEPAATHPNEELLERYWKATTTGDIETMKTLLADDVVYHYPGQHWLSGDYHGKDAVAGLFTTLASLAVKGGMFEGHLHAVAVGGEFSVVILSYRLHLLADKSLPGRACGLFRIVDGKVREYWLFEWDQRMINDVFWSSAPRALVKRGDYLGLAMALPRSALGVVRTLGRVFSGYRAPTAV